MVNEKEIEKILSKLTEEERNKLMEFHITGFLDSLHRNIKKSFKEFLRKRDD